MHERLHAHAPPRRAVPRRGRSSAGPEADTYDDRIGAADGGSRLRAARALQGQAGNAAVRSALMARGWTGASTHSTAPSSPRLGLFDDDETTEATTTESDTVADPQSAVEELGSFDSGQAAQSTIENVGQAGGDDTTPLNNATAGVGSTTFNVVPVEENRNEDTLNDVASVLSARGEAGSTQPGFGTISTSLGANGVVQSATLTVTETVTTPTWTKRDAQCDPIKNEWDRFHVAITAHEQKHVDIDRKFFSGIHAKLVGVKDSDVDAKVETIKTDADTENRAFDGRTAHGVNEGTGINAGIRCSSKVP